MATTKRAPHRFRVKEGPDFTHEPRDGVIELLGSVFISAEPCGKEPVSERPLPDPDFLSFGLKLGTSLEKAQKIADFLNENLENIAITRFGDAEDAARDVMQSERIQRIDLERFTMVMANLKERLAANDVSAVAEVMGAVEYLIRDWTRALIRSREILDKFGRGEEHA